MTAAIFPLFRCVALFILVLSPSVVSAQIPEFDAFYVFGDSLADNGNILIQTRVMGMQPPAPPSATPHRTYFEGRFSNGYVGVEYLWERLTGADPGSSGALRAFLAAPLVQNRAAVNFAFGGTGTPYVDKTPGGFSAPGLKGQVELFRASLRGKKPSSRALYAIATGANDYRIDQYNVPMSRVDVVRNIEDAIVSLYRIGARDILVFDLPDLGKLPGSGQDPVGAQAATENSALHNALLYAMLARVESAYPRLRIIPIKLARLFDQLEATMNTELPLIAAFSPTDPFLAAACLFINPVLCGDVPDILFNRDLDFRFVFWDVVHPTTEAHRYLAEYMYVQLAAEYE